MGLRTRILILGGVGLLALVLPRSARAVISCPPADELGFPLGQSDPGPPLFCSYPGYPGEDPYDFYCEYDTTTGALTYDNDAGLCPAYALGAPPTATPTETGTPTVTPTPSNTPTVTPTQVAGPMITGGNTAGSSTLTGQTGKSDDCIPHALTLYLCSGNGFGPCYTGGDTVVAGATFNPPNPGSLSMVTITVPSPPAPLQAGQKLYFTDGCTDPLLSAPALVTGEPSAPVMSPPLIALLAGILGLLGLLGVAQVRRKT